MDSSLSVLKTVVKRARAYTDSTDLDAKYTDSFIMNNCVLPAASNIWSRLFLTSDNPIYLYYEFDVTADEPHYNLPPCVQMVTRVCQKNDYGQVIRDSVPRSNFNWMGAGWRLEGNQLVIDPPPQQDIENVLVEYIPNGDVLMHYGSGTLATVSGESQLTLAATPTLGLLDRRDNAYGGCILRLLHAAPAEIEELVIASSFKDGSNWKVETRTPSGVASGSVTYEILQVPAGQSFMEALSTGAAQIMGSYKNLDPKRLSTIGLQHKLAMKTLADWVSNMQARNGKFWKSGTVDSNETVWRGSFNQRW